MCHCPTGDIHNMIMVAVIIKFQRHARERQRHVGDFSGQSTNSKSLCACNRFHTTDNKRGPRLLYIRVEIGSRLYALECAAIMYNDLFNSC